MVHLRNAAALAHAIKADNRLDRTDQDAIAWEADEVQAPVDAVASIDIGMTRLPEHAGVTERWTAKAMRCRIVRGISLGLDDDATNAADQKAGSDQRARDRGHLPYKEAGRKWLTRLYRQFYSVPKLKMAAFGS